MKEQLKVMGLLALAGPLHASASTLQFTGRCLVAAGLKAAQSGDTLAVKANSCYEGADREVRVPSTEDHLMSKMITQFFPAVGEEELEEVKEVKVAIPKPDDFDEPVSPAPPVAKKQEEPVQAPKPEPFDLSAAAEILQQAMSSGPSAATV